MGWLGSNGVGTHTCDGVQNMCGWCAKHVWLVCKTCVVGVQDMCGWCAKHVWLVRMMVHLPTSRLWDVRYIMYGSKHMKHNPDFIDWEVLGVVINRDMQVCVCCPWRVWLSLFMVCVVVVVHDVCGCCSWCV